MTWGRIGPLPFDVIAGPRPGDPGPRAATVLVCYPGCPGLLPGPNPRTGMTKRRGAGKGEEACRWCSGRATELMTTLAPDT